MDGKLPAGWLVIDDWNNGVSPSLVTLVISIAAALLLHFGLFKVARHLSRRSKWRVDGIVLREVRRPSRLLFVLLAIQAASYSVTLLDDSVLGVIRHVLTMMVILVAARVAMKALHAIEQHLRTQHRTDVRDNYVARRVHTQMGILRRVSSMLVTIIGAALVLMTFPRAREFGASLLASAGLAGLIVGLAARPVFENLIAGVQIALTQPINLDDVVIVEGEWGWIEEIGSAYVVVRIWDQRRLIVPLSYFIQNPFQNWTRRSADILGSVFLYVDYSLSIAPLREKLREIVSACEHWDGRVCVLQVTDAKEHTLELRALASAADSPTAWELRVHIREKLIEYLQEEFPDSLPRFRVEHSQQ